MTKQEHYANWRTATPKSLTESVVLSDGEVSYDLHIGQLHQRLCGDGKQIIGLSIRPGDGIRKDRLGRLIADEDMMKVSHISLQSGTREIIQNKPLEDLFPREDARYHVLSMLDEGLDTTSSKITVAGGTPTSENGKVIELQFFYL